MCLLVHVVLEMRHVGPGVLVSGMIVQCVVLVTCLVASVV